MPGSKSDDATSRSLFHNPNDVASSPRLNRVQKRALKDLDILMSGFSAIRQFVQWHKAFDPHLQDLEDAQCILDELGRSGQDRPSNHIIWKNLVTSCRQIDKWRRQIGKYSNWEAAEVGKGQMPYLGLPAQLRALHYLGEGSRCFPQYLRECLQNVDLKWYIDDKMAPSQWWLGADLGDPKWRNTHMQTAPKFRTGEIDADVVVGLMKKAFVRSMDDPKSAPLDPRATAREPLQTKLVAKIDTHSATTGGGGHGSRAPLHQHVSAPVDNINDMWEQLLATSMPLDKVASTLKKIQSNSQRSITPKFRQTTSNIRVENEKEMSQVELFETVRAGSKQAPEPSRDEVLEGAVMHRPHALNCRGKVSSGPPPQPDHSPTQNAVHLAGRQPSKRPSPRGSTPDPKRARRSSLHHADDKDQDRGVQRLDSDQVGFNMDIQQRKSNVQDSQHRIDALKRVANQQANASMELAVTVAEALSSMDKTYDSHIAEIKSRLSIHNQHLGKLQSAIQDRKEKDSEREKAIGESEQRFEARLRGVEARMAKLERENEGLKNQIEALKQQEDKMARLERLVNELMNGMDAVGRCFDQMRSAS